MTQLVRPYTKNRRFRDGIGMDDRLLRARGQLARSRAALDTCDILFIGDSITEGSNATVLANRYCNVCVAELRRDWNASSVTGGDGWVAVYQETSPNPPAAVTTNGTVSGTTGLGNRNVNLDNTDTLTWTGTCTQFYVAYTKRSGGGTFGVQVDSGSVTNVDTSNATTVPGVLYDSGSLGSAASRTITLSVISGSSQIEGLFIINGDAASGVRMWVAGDGGAQASAHMNATWLSAIANISPDLCVIAFGVNEWFNATSPATFKSNIQTLITNVRANATPDPSFVLISYYERNGVVNAYEWSEYVDALYQIAVSDPEVAVFDLLRYFPDAPYGATIGLMADSAVHPNNSGHRLMGQQLARFIGG